MADLLELFKTDTPLLQTRGSLIIRQLSVLLDAEKVYRALAAILEGEKNVEFASSMIQTLNIIALTAQELTALRKLLRCTLTSADGGNIFTALYKSWCHSPVSTLSLCLYAGAYEHAASLVPIFATLQVTVPMLVQIDKLVQLLESPVFTHLRLQLLEPARFPFLHKSLYGLLMLLPQSSAFNTLRTRLKRCESLLLCSPRR